MIASVVKFKKNKEKDDIKQEVDLMYESFKGSSRTSQVPVLVPEVTKSKNFLAIFVIHTRMHVVHWSEHA